MSLGIRFHPRHPSHRRPILAMAGLLGGCAILVGAACTAAAERFVAIAWNDSQQGGAFVQRFGTESPWAFNGDAIAVGGSPTLRIAGDRLYAVSYQDGRVTAIDCTSWSAVRDYDVGPQSHPLDIAVVSPEIAYLTRSDSTELLRLNLDTGVVEHALDLAGFTNPGGVLAAGMMAIDAGRLIVQVSRFDAPAVVAAVDPTGYLAVVDIATEQLVDVDPVTPGIQAIALQGTFAKYKMNVLRDPRRLYVSASGAYFDEGGLEAVDLDALASLGLVVAESDGTTGADLGSFVMVAPDRGFLVSSTDFVASSHLAHFSLTGGALPEELFVTVDYRVPTMVHDPQTHTFFVPDGGTTNAYYVFDADTGEQLNHDLPRLGGRAADIELLCDPELSCDCAVGYACQAVPAASEPGRALLVFALVLTGIGLGSAYLDSPAARARFSRRTRAI